MWLTKKETRWKKEWAEHKRVPNSLSEYPKQAKGKASTAPWWS
jgi:hypothetical protein